VPGLSLIQEGAVSNGEDELRITLASAAIQPLPLKLSLASKCEKYFLPGSALSGWLSLIHA
jgi:hypothetical protein